MPRLDVGEHLAVTQFCDEKCYYHRLAYMACPVKGFIGSPLPRAHTVHLAGHGIRVAGPTLPLLVHVTPEVHLWMLRGPIHRNALIRQARTVP